LEEGEGREDSHNWWGEEKRKTRGNEKGEGLLVRTRPVLPARRGRGKEEERPQQQKEDY